MEMAKNSLEELFIELSKDAKFLYHYNRTKPFYDFYLECIKSGKSNDEVQIAKLYEYKRTKGE